MSSSERLDPRRFERITFEDFRALATDDSLSRYERIGFPDSYREGSEEAIAEDIVAKLPSLAGRGARFLDIGPGCSGLPHLLLELCASNEHETTLIDSPEMLAHLPDGPHVRKLPGSFPDSVRLPAGSDGSFDAILAYSVLQHVLLDGGVDRFVDRALALLAHGGAMLIGDVPNVSKRDRFLSSPAGLDFHRTFTGSTGPPPVTGGPVPADRIDDGLVLGVVARARSAGFDAYVVPLRADLPLANRREDILIQRP